MKSRENHSLPETGAEPLVTAVAARGRLDGGDEGDELNYEGIWMVASTPA